MRILLVEDEKRMAQALCEMPQRIIHLPVITNLRMVVQYRNNRTESRKTVRCKDLTAATYPAITIKCNHKDKTIYLFLRGLCLALAYWFLHWDLFLPLHSKDEDKSKHRGKRLIEHFSLFGCNFQ